MRYFLIFNILLTISMITVSAQETEGELINENANNETMNINSNSPEESFQIANQLYMAEQYADALKTYESVVEMGLSSAKLYFNMGNASYKSGNIPKAILYYERAALLDPNDEDIRFNIELSNQFIVDKIDPLPQPFFVQWYNWLLNRNSADGWGIFSLVSFVLTLVFASMFVFSASPLFKKISFSMGIVLLVISASTFAFASQQKTKAVETTAAIIFTPTVTAKGSPDESGTSLFVIHEGLKVDVLEEISGWYKIRLIDGNIGWVRKEVLEMI